jgi:hypothetical protein
MNKEDPPPCLIPLAPTPVIDINEAVANYITSEGCQLYSTASQKLEEELYDCQPLMAFINYRSS